MRGRGQAQSQSQSQSQGRGQTHGQTQGQTQGQGQGQGQGQDQGRGQAQGQSQGRDGDRGTATVWVAVTGVTLCAVFAVVLALGQAVAARHRAGGAADLAALAAADRALEGPAAACEAAGRVALAQDASIVRCVVEGDTADVTARAGFGLYEPAVRSRAGRPSGVR
ncbi:Rv3654c family TadE-like protein [Streptomyces sp. NPDC088729]|uniref:Rv3654c family TadE-like protein n=1 Tax=Streptomyces sp. NPDC088729 TaxID=3365876 RepID=UPI00382F40E3